MAQFYGLPVASLRAAAWRKMLEGGSGFDVRGWQSSPRQQRQLWHCTQEPSPLPAAAGMRVLPSSLMRCARLQQPETGLRTDGPPTPAAAMPTTHTPAAERAALTLLPFAGHHHSEAVWRRPPAGRQLPAVL